VKPDEQFNLSIVKAGGVILNITSSEESVDAEWESSVKIPHSLVDWRVRAAPTPKGLSAKHGSLPFIVLAAGILVASLFLLASQLGLRALSKSRKISRLNERLAKIMKLAPVGIFQHDAEGACVFVNDHWCEMTGIGQQEAQGDGWKSAIHPEDKEVVVAEWERALKEGHPFSLLYRYLDKQGNTHWVKTKSTELLDQNGNCIGLLGAVQDFTRQKFAEEDLRESRNFLQAVLDSLPVALFCKDAKNDFSFSLWNRAAENLWGLSEGRVIGKTDRDFFPKEQADFFRSIDEKTMRDGMIVEILEEQVLSPTKVPVIDTRGEPRFLLGISQDISEKKEIERLLEKQRLQIVQAEKMSSLGEMAGGIAHEINNPLATLELASHQLVLATENEIIDRLVVRKNAERISATVDRVAKIIKGLRSFARDGENDPFLSASVKEVILETLDFCQARFGKHKVHIRMQEVSDNLKLECRQTQISQVLLNLLSNAFDAVRPEPDSWIEIKAQERENMIEIRITDSGPGIPALLAEEIMKPFFTTKPAGKGTGLGLSISQMIIQSHNGSLALEMDSKHTCFVIKLPKFQENMKVSA